MSLIFSSKQFDQRAELYLRLAQLVSAGIPLIKALETTARSAPSPAFRAPLEQLVTELQRGATFHDALLHAGNWQPEFDIALLGAAEKSGRLDAVLRLLADHYKHRAKLARQFVGALLYPTFLFHFAVLIFPPRKLQMLVLEWNVTGYLLQTFAVLLPVYAVVIVAVLAAQGRHSENWRGFLESVLNPIPILGSARRAAALTRLAAALEALISAGITIIEAWDIAVSACGSPALKREVASWKPSLLAGLTPSDTLNSSRHFPELFANLYHTGEVSGQLDDSLRRLKVFYEEESARKLEIIVQWVPKIIYLMVALGIAWAIIGAYSGHIKEIRDVIGD